jgi:hypothetical protein
MRPQLFFVVLARVLFAALVVVAAAEAGWQQWGWIPACAGMTDSQDFSTDNPGFRTDNFNFKFRFRMDSPGFRLPRSNKFSPPVSHVREMI